MENFANKTEKLTVVSQSPVEDSSEHERFVEKLGNSIFIGGDSNDTVLGERPRSYNIRDENVSERDQSCRDSRVGMYNLPSANNRIDCSKFLIKTGLKTLSYRVKRNHQNQSTMHVNLERLTSNCPMDPATDTVILFPIT